MFRKSLSSLLFAVVFAFSAAAVFAQSPQPITGTIEMEKDGAKAPLAGAQVDLFREDVRGQGQSVTTKEDGTFVFANAQAGQTFMISVSAPNASPTYLPGVKAGMKNVLITLEPGDGRKVTEDELKDAIKNANAQMSEEDKKKQAELEKKRQEIAAKNARIQESTKIVDESLKAGVEAFKNKDYTTAIAKFDAGYKAAPDYEGSAPVLLNNKAIALRMRANALVVTAQKGTPEEKSAAITKVTPDYTAALAAIEQGLEVIEKAPADSNAAAALPAKKKDLYANYVKTLADMFQLSISLPEGTDAAKALAGYLETETDAKKQSDLLVTFGDQARKGGAFSASATAFRKILEKNPKDLDALGGLTISVGGLAFSDVSPAKANSLMQEAEKYGKQFLDSAPKNHKNYAEVTGILDGIKAIKAENSSEKD